MLGEPSMIQTNAGTRIRGKLPASPYIAEQNGAAAVFSTALTWASAEGAFPPVFLSPYRVQAD